MPIHCLRVMAALVAICLLSLSASAQQGRPTRVPVLVATVDSLPNTTTPFLIVRRTEGEPRDVILLRAGASADQLSDAVHALLLVRRETGDVPSTGGTLRVRPGARRGARPALPWAPRVLADLRRAEPREVPGVGLVPAVEIWLPRQDTAAARQ